MEKRKSAQNRPRTRVQSLWRSTRPRSIVYFVLFAAIGTIVLLSVRAASPTANIDIGTSGITSPAQSISSTTASGGSAVKFNKVSSSGTGEFRIVGRDIVDPNGNKYFPVGANVSVKILPVQYVFEGNTGTSTGHSSDVQAWGWNTVRATIICVADTTGPTKQQIYNGLDTFINEYTAKKIVVIIECHDMTAGSGNDGNTNLMANQWVPGLQTFWTDMANKYKANPYVWFNTVNEPMGWTNGQWSNWQTFQTNFYNLIRNTGAKNIFVADIPYWGQDLSFLSSDQNKINWSKSKCNTLLSTHVYGGAGNYTQTGQYMKTIVDSGIPLISGEFGVDVQNPNDQNRRDAANAVIDFGKQYGIGALWWHGNGDTNTEVHNSLKKIGYPVSIGAAYFVDGNPNNLSEFGQKFWNLSHSPPALGKFTGNYADSHCN